MRTSINKIPKCSLEEAHILIAKNERRADGTSSRKNHRAVRKNPETGVRKELDFSSRLPREKLEEWIAPNRIEYDLRDFHIEELEEKLRHEEYGWWIIVNGQ